MRNKKPPREPCNAELLDENGQSIWDLNRKACNRCNHLYTADNFHCPACESPEYRLVLATPPEPVPNVPVQHD